MGIAYPLPPTPTDFVLRSWSDDMVNNWCTTFSLGYRHWPLQWQGFCCRLQTPPPIDSCERCSLGPATGQWQLVGHLFPVMKSIIVLRWKQQSFSFKIENFDTVFLKKPKQHVNLNNSKTLKFHMSIVLCTGTCTLQKAKYFFFSKLPAGKYIQMTIFRNLLLLKLSV